MGVLQLSSYVCIGFSKVPPRTYLYNTAASNQRRVIMGPNILWSCRLWNSITAKRIQDRSILSFPLSQNLITNSSFICDKYYLCTWNCSANSAKQNKNNFTFATCTKHKNQQRSESIVEVWRNYGSFSYALRCNKDHQLFFKRYFFKPWFQITQSVFLSWLVVTWRNCCATL